MPPAAPNRCQAPPGPILGDPNAPRAASDGRVSPRASAGRRPAQRPRPMTRRELPPRSTKPKARPGRAVWYHAPHYGSPSSRLSGTPGGLHARPLARPHPGEPARVPRSLPAACGWRVPPHRPYRGDRSVNALDDVVAASAGELAAAIRDRRLSSAEVVEAHLRRIDEVNPRVNAIVQVTGDAALARAREADAALASGRATGPLHGVPFTVKDICDVAGGGSAAGPPRPGRVLPHRDAAVLAPVRPRRGVALRQTHSAPG